jgi:hypothetical protein
MGDAAEAIELPPPAIIKPVEMWTGKQLFSLMLRPTSRSTLRVNLEGPNKKYNTARVKPEPTHMCPDDGWVCFQDSELISGMIDKAIVGGGSKTSLFSALLRGAPSQGTSEGASPADRAATPLPSPRVLHTACAARAFWSPRCTLLGCLLGAQTIRRRRRRWRWVGSPS